MKIRATMLLAVTLLTLGGCHHHHSTAKNVAATAPGIVVSQARLVLPVVKGNPGAAYFTLANEASAPATVTGVTIAGVGKTQMHETRGGDMPELTAITINPGKSVIFAPGGKHVMAFEISPSLTPGSGEEMILHFSDGKTTSAPLRIETMSGEAVDRMAPMAGMNMGGNH